LTCKGVDYIAPQRAVLFLSTF